MYFSIFRAVVILGYAYWKVTGDVSSLTTADKILSPILMGIVGTVAVFGLYQDL